MPTLTESATSLLPSVSASFYVNIIVGAIILVVVCCVIGLILWWYLVSRLFNKKVVIFEKVDDKFRPTKKDKAREIRLGTGGDTIFFIKKLKKYVPVPVLQTGDFAYWFYVREDRELINFDLEDLDEKCRLMGGHMVHMDMRLARASLQKQLKDRYSKAGWWSKYGGLVGYTLLILMLGIMFFLLMDKYLQITDRVIAAVKIGKEVAQLNKEILVAMDNVCSGSGVVKV